MSSRERILRRVRAGLASDAPGQRLDHPGRRAIVEKRLTERPRHLTPERVAGQPQAELAAILRRWLELTGGHMFEVASAADVPAEIATYLRGYNLPARVRIGADARLAALPWGREPALAVDHGPALATDTASVTHALAAVAETGTAVVASGADNPVTLSFLPETNIVVVAREDIVGPLEDALVRARGSALPRTLNLVTGPSRSADIGGIPVLGAHGPRRLCMIVVG